LKNGRRVYGRYLNKINCSKYFIKEIKVKYEIDLEEKILQFALSTIRFLSLLPVRREFDVISYQLSKSATSIGANLPCEII